MTSSTATSHRDPEHPKPQTLGELRSIPDFDARTAATSVKNEIRRNLLRAIEKDETLFPGVHGYEDTVIPQIVNALLSRHNFILLGLRGQARAAFCAAWRTCSMPRFRWWRAAKSMTTRSRRICRACRDKIAAEGDTRPSRGCRATSATSKSLLRPT